MMTTLAEVFVGKNNNLTFIRLVAAMAVIYGHTSAIVPGSPPDWVAQTTGFAFLGGVAVDLFFLISGFLVTASIIKGGVRRYVVSRFLRIYPALWVHLILVTFIVGSLITTLPVSDYLVHPDVWSYFSRLAGTYGGAFFLPGVFTANYNHAINGSIWSVLIEVWIYGFVLAAYLVGLMRSRAIFNVVFFIIIVGTWYDSSWVPNFISGKTNLHVILFFYIGSFLYLNRESVPTSPYFMLFSLFLAGITLGTDRFPFAYVLVIVSFFCSASFSSQFAWFDKFGDYSYGVYLYGWPSQQIIAHYFPALSGLENCMLSSVLALFCGFLSWHLVEKRAMNLRKYFKYNPVRLKQLWSLKFGFLR